jgi:HlyD family secretion protein
MRIRHREQERAGGLRINVLASVLAVMAVMAALALQSYKRLAASPDKSEPVFITARGRLDITVREAGTISPSEQIILKSELEGRSTILFLAPEGTQVKTGDLLVELDATNLEARRIDQEIKLQNAEAAFIRSRENLEVVRNQAQSDVEKAELTLQFAREDLEQYKAGEYPNKVKELEARITLAREEQQRAQEKLKWSQVLFAEKYLSASEIRADELSVRKSGLDVDLALDNLGLLQQFESKRQITKLESDARQAGMAQERAVRKARSDVIQAEVDLRAKESEFTQNKSQAEKLSAQIAKAKIRAPRDGLVVFATSTQVQSHGNVEPLAEGQEVRERQALIYLPTASSFISKIKIHESNLKRICRDMPVTLTVGALPGMTFTGNVATIAPLPDAMSTFMNPDLKLYDTEIRIEGGGDVLRTGMSSETTIQIASHENAVYVPVHCVVRVGGRPVVFVATPDGPVQRAVRIGDNNNLMVHILEGLEPGEPVLLAPPMNAADETGGPDAVPSAEGGAEGGAERQRRAPRRAQEPVS